MNFRIQGFSIDFRQKMVSGMFFFSKFSQNFDFFGFMVKRGSLFVELVSSKLEKTNLSF